MKKLLKYTIGMFLLAGLFILPACSNKTTTTAAQPRSGIPNVESRTYDKKSNKKATAQGKRMKKGSVAPTSNAFSEQRRKEYRKQEALKAKPQYSDPMYFGHKKKPKKRKRGKRKFCKECGMTH